MPNLTSDLHLRTLGEITFDKHNKVRLAGALGMIEKAMERRFKGRALRVGVRSLSDGPPTALQFHSPKLKI